MKLIVCILALAVAINAFPADHDFGNAVRFFYNKAKEQMPCGIKGSGSLAPFVIEEAVGKEPLKYSMEGWEFEFHMTKAKFDGLNTFEILKSFYNKATGKFEMLFVMPKLSFEGVYSMLNKINTDYLDAKMINNGTVHFHMSDSAKYGFEFFFGTNKTTNDIMVEKFKFIYPEDMKSFEFDLSEEKKEYYEEFKEMLKQIEKEFDEMYNDYMAMRFNKIFAGYKTVEDLADYLYKMAGDEEHGLFNEPKCNHV